MFGTPLAHGCRGRIQHSTVRVCFCLKQSDYAALSLARPAASLMRKAILLLPGYAAREGVEKFLVPPAPDSSPSAYGERHPEALGNSGRSRWSTGSL